MNEFFLYLLYLAEFLCVVALLAIFLMLAQGCRKAFWTFQTYHKLRAASGQPTGTLMSKEEHDAFWDWAEFLADDADKGWKKLSPDEAVRDEFKNNN